MNKDFIISEIKRTTESNGGEPLGISRFFKETGIAESDWSGKYWVRWSEALIEAGYSPNKLQDAYSDEYIIEKLVSLIRELGHYPVIREIKLRGHNDPEFPSHNVFQNRGKKSELVEMVRRYCDGPSGYDDVLEIIGPLVISSKKPAATEADQPNIGYVYLMKSGPHYTIGKSDYPGRRNYEHERKLPKKIKTIHTIKTDDPFGVEAYWHNRFKEKRTETYASWYKLNANDVINFKRWKKIF